MQHLGTCTLQTHRLVLRRFQVDDAKAMFDNWAGDGDVVRYLTWPAHPNVEATQQIVQHWVQQYSHHDFYQWAIVLKGLGQPIGGISVVEHRDDIAMVQIGYCIGKAWWHQGITSEALAAVMEFFFGRVGVNRIECRHDVNNPHSGGVMMKCGMKYEGISRQGDLNNQGVCDCAHYAILARDYAAQQTVQNR
nr:GNAT family N-acetyltransferase [bacterium]